MKEPCTYLIFEAPLPPSQNAANIVVKFGKRASIGKSAKYKDYLNMITEQFWPAVRMKGKYDFSGPLLFWTITYPARAGCDTDNYHKVLLDCMEKAKAFKNDNQVVSTHNERGPRVGKGMIRVYIAQEKKRAILSRQYFEDFKAIQPLREGPILHASNHFQILPQP